MVPAGGYITKPAHQQDAAYDQRSPEGEHRERSKTHCESPGPATHSRGVPCEPYPPIMPPGPIIPPAPIMPPIKGPIRAIRTSTTRATRSVRLFLLISSPFLFAYRIGLYSFFLTKPNRGKKARLVAARLACSPSSNQQVSHFSTSFN